jgi:hypothetical protein
VSAGKETMLRMRQGRTHVALNSNSTPTAAFVKNANWQNPAEACAAAIATAVGVQALSTFNADAAATKLLGDSIYTNPLMMGYAWQVGRIPLSLVALGPSVLVVHPSLPVKDLKGLIALAKSEVPEPWKRMVLPFEMVVAPV